MLDYKITASLSLSDTDLTSINPNLKHLEDTPPVSPKKFTKNPKKLQRGHGPGSGLQQSFRKMAETVYLRPKHNSGEEGGGKLQRKPSKRSTVLSKFFDSKSDEKDRRKSKDELIARGIYKKENVFGNELRCIKTDPVTGLPDFLVKCVRKIEEHLDTVGLYRINGDAALVQKIRQVFKIIFRNLQK